MSQNKLSKYTLTELKKAARTDISKLPGMKLAVLGDCSTQHLSEAIRGIGRLHGIGLEIFDADYDQIHAQIEDKHSELYEFEPNAVLFFLSVEKIYERFCDIEISQRNNFAAEREQELRAWHKKLLSAKNNLYILQTLYPEYDDRVFGSYGSMLQSSFIYQLRKLNMLISDLCAGEKRAFAVDLGFIQNTYGRETVHDSKLYSIAKLSHSHSAIPAAAEEIVSVIDAVRGNIKKCVILDLDGTLWGGVIGDDGIGNIEIGDLGAGHAFSNFQRFLKELKNRGILLAVCSKNNESTAKEPFENHPDMILRLPDFAAFTANWEDKASNICSIRDKLNIGFDSIVFIDDNPFERGLVRKMLPEVTVPEMPEDPAEYVDFLRRENLFGTVSFSDEDLIRTDRYRAESERTAFAATVSDYGDYLAGLDMKACARSFEPFWYSRIAQLTQRSNQFNLRTVRYTEDDIRRIAEDSSYITIYITLSDNFGDHGLISVIILKREADRSLFIDTWLMSCRVLKRGVEDFAAGCIAEIALKENAPRVTGEYLPTAKNSMVADLYEKLGFSAVRDGRFEMYPDKFVPKKNYITKTDE